MHRAVIALAIFSSWASRAALAQQTISEYFVGGGFCLIFCEEDIRALDTEAHLTDEQEEAARLILKSAARKIQTIEIDGRNDIMTKHDWEAALALPEEQQEAAFAEVRAGIARDSVTVANRCATLEFEALRDLQAVLTPDQLKNAWPRFERSRRRLLVSVGDTRHFGPDPRQLVAGAKLDPADLANAQAALALHDEAIDPLIIRRMSQIAQHNRSVVKDGQVAKNPDVWNSPPMMTREIRQLNVRTVRELERVLSEGGQQKLARQRVCVELADIIPRPSRDYTIRPVLALDSLTAEQLAQIETLGTAADHEALDQAMRLLRSEDEVALRAEADPPEVAQKRRGEASMKTGEITNALLKDIRELLTADQRDELDGKEGSHAFSRAFNAPRRPWYTPTAWIDSDPQPAANPGAPPPQTTTP